MATRSKPEPREASPRETIVSGYTRKTRWDKLFRNAIEDGDIEEAIRIAVEQVIEGRKRRPAAGRRAA